MAMSATPKKRPNGCLKFTGCLLTVGSVLFIVLCVCMIFVSEDKMDENRAEYAASYDEYQQAMDAYDADSVHLRAEYRRIEQAIAVAEEQGDSALAASLTDSLALYAEPEYVRRGAIGFNIGGAFFFLFACCAIVPLLIGIVLLVNYRRSKRKYETQLSNQL